MKFIKEEEEKTRDYILQKDSKTKATSKSIIVILILLVLAVIASGIYFLNN